jgi:glycerol transport system ATP-binding protein
MMHIEDCLRRLPRELSGGQQQRTALARALIKDADLLLLDEPLVNLDYKLREELRFELRELFATREAIIVYATAEPEEALALGGNTMVIDEGRILQTGPAGSVYRRPANVRTARLVSDPPMNIVSGRLSRETIQLAGEQLGARPEHLRLLPNGPYCFGVRPNHLSMARKSPSDIGIRSRVELAEVNGSETSVYFEHGSTSWVSRLDGVHRFEVGQEIELFVEPSRIFAFDTEESLAAAPNQPTAGES